MDDVALGSMVQLIRGHDFTEVPKIHFQYMEMTTPDPDFKNQVCNLILVCICSPVLSQLKTKNIQSRYFMYHDTTEVSVIPMT